MPVTHIHLPFGQGRMKAISGKITHGRGMGSVVLDGGQGGQSSYDNIDQYIATTGVNPYANQNKKSGTGLDALNKKLDGLNILGPKKKKNIRMTL